MSKSLSSGQLAALLGVTNQTIRKYAKEGTIPFHKKPSGHLFFTPEDQKTILGENHLTFKEEKWVYYLRSSSGKQSSFEGQLNSLTKNFPTPVTILKDSASGLNENRKNLWKLVQMAQNSEITDIAITNKDRLSRFGAKYLEELFTQNNVRVHYLNEEKDIPAEQELMDDFMALIASFSGRFYKLRSKDNSKKLLERASKELGE